MLHFVSSQSTSSHGSLTSPLFVFPLTLNDSCPSNLAIFNNVKENIILGTFVID